MTKYLSAGAVALAVAAALFLARPAPESSDSSPVAPTAEPASTAAAAASEPAACARCHKDVVEAFRGHGMARSIGPATGVEPGTVTNPRTGTRYEVAAGADGAWLTAAGADGGRRRQRIVGRIGAGIFDTAWVTSEADADGVANGRVFFAPVETVTGHGLQLSPFELHADSPGLGMAVTRECLTCHTLDARAPGKNAFPANALGAATFDALSPLTCSACHGDTATHAANMRGERGEGAGLGITRLARLSAGTQRDACARCHLQGDARIDLVDGHVDRDRPIAAQIPVLVPRRAIDDFRFVSQVERLALSACFRASPRMTCTTCHDPHSPVAAQGTASFDRACVSCHTDSDPHVQRERTGCVGCHVRRSQPFDLPHVRTADHFIRRRIPPAEDDVPHRQFAAREGSLALYDDGRLANALATPEGRRWQSGVMAMGLTTMGRFEEAARNFAAFPAPGSNGARTPAAPAGFAPLETNPAFHTVRGLVLMGAGRLEPAHAALSDAIALDPRATAARLARARLSLDMGDVRGAMVDTQAVIDAHPQSEAPWNLRVEIAQRVGRLDLALSAADASTRLWPSNARAWTTLAALARQAGDDARAQAALERARALEPALAAQSSGGRGTGPHAAETQKR